MEIEMRECKKFEPVCIPDEVYSAVVAHVEERELKYGMSLIIGFSIIQPGEHHAKIVEGITSASLNDKTKLYNWIQAMGLKDIKIGEKLNTESIKGATCRIISETDNRTDQEGRVFKQSKVVKVLPLVGKENK